MEYVTFVTLADFEAQRNRAFVFPLQTVCGLFKLTIRKKGLSLVAAIELCAPTFNGSEQFPWILPGVTINLKLLNTPGHNYSGNWTFSTNSRTWITEYMSCAELYKTPTTQQPTTNDQPIKSSRIPPSGGVSGVSVAGGSGGGGGGGHKGSLNSSSRKSPAVGFRSKKNNALSTTTTSAHTSTHTPENTPPTIEVRMILTSTSLQIFPISEKALIHTSARYTYIHRTLHCLLLSNIFLNHPQASNKELQHLLNEFSSLKTTSSSFHRFVATILRADSKILFEDFASTFRGIVSQLVKDVDDVVRVIDWEGDPSSLMNIARSFSDKILRHSEQTSLPRSGDQSLPVHRNDARILILRLNGESGFLKTLMRRIAIDIPTEIILSSNERYKCIGAFLGMSRHELCLMRSSWTDEWLRITDHGYSDCVVKERITCHKRLLPNSLIFCLDGGGDGEDRQKSSTEFAIRCSTQKFSGSKSLASGCTSAGGLALSSTHYIPSSDPQFDITSTIKAPCLQAYYGVIPWNKRVLSDMTALDEILRLGDDGADHLLTGSEDNSGSTSASSDICKVDRSLSWFRLASLYYKHIGYRGILWADTLIHNSDSFPTLWPVGVTEQIFKTRTQIDLPHTCATGANLVRSSAEYYQRRTNQIKRKSASCRISLAEFTKQVPAGKRRRLPRSAADHPIGRDHITEIHSVAPGRGHLSRHHTRESPDDSEPIFHSSERWFAIRLIMSNILHSIFDHREPRNIHNDQKRSCPSRPQWPPAIPEPGLAPIRLSFEFDPNYAYDLLLPRELTSSEFRSKILLTLQECQNSLTSWSDWTGWSEDVERGTLSLWRRHGTTWRQILGKLKLRQQLIIDVDSQEVLIMQHPPGSQPPSLTETLLDVVYLQQYTFEPIHVGYVTSLSSSTVEDLYISKITPRLSIHTNRDERGGGGGGGVDDPTPTSSFKMMPNYLSCTSNDGTLILESLAIKKLRMSQGALIFNVLIPVNTRPSKRIPRATRICNRRHNKLYIREPPNPDEPPTTSDKNEPDRVETTTDRLKSGSGGGMASGGSGSISATTTPAVSGGGGGGGGDAAGVSGGGGGIMRAEGLSGRRKKQSSSYWARSAAASAAASAKVSIQSNVMGAEMRALELMWQEFISTSGSGGVTPNPSNGITAGGGSNVSSTTSGGDSVSLLALGNLLRKYKARAARYIDQIRVIDSRVCQLMAICGEALLPSMLKTKSSSRRLVSGVRAIDCTVAQTLVNKLQNCLIHAASNFDQELCRDCIKALHVVDLDQPAVGGLSSCGGSGGFAAVVNGSGATAADH